MDEEVLRKYRVAGRVAKDALEYGLGLIREGIRLTRVADGIEERIRSTGAKPAFPVNLAINDVAAHFTPKHNDKTVFENGWLVKVDVGAHVDGYIGDNARTIEVGTVNWQGLIVAAEEALKNAIAAIKPKVKLKHIGRVVEQTMESYRVKPITNLTGHSMERFKLHAGKSVPNILDDSEDMLEVDDVVAIEPFSTTGMGRVEGDKPSNIFRIVRQTPLPKPELNSFLSKIFKEHRTLPFSGRWCSSIERNAQSYLKKLIKQGAIASYPILREANRGMVAQAEHTVIVTESGCEVIT
jgi:methionyl aminopeptidase